MINLTKKVSEFLLIYLTDDKLDSRLDPQSFQISRHKDQDVSGTVCSGILTPILFSV